MKYLIDHFHADPNATLADLRLAVSKRLRLPPSAIRLDVLSKQLQWSDKNKSMEMIYDLCVDTNEFIKDTTIRFLPELEATTIKDYSKKSSPVIIGAGIVGLSLALTLARAGIKPIVLEKGLETLNSNKTLQIEDEKISYGGFHGRNGGLFVHERTALSEDVFQRLVRAGRVQITSKDRYLFLSPEDCIALAASFVGEIRKLGGQVMFGCEWIGCDYFLGKLKKVRFMHDGREESIKTKEVIFTCGALDLATVNHLAESKIDVKRKGNRVGIIIEYPYTEYKSCFLKGSRSNWPPYFVYETFKGKDGREIRFTGPYLHGEIHSHGVLSPNELRLALDGKEETSTVKFVLSVDVNDKEGRRIIGEDNDSPLFYMTSRKDRPLAVPVEMVTDFVSKREPWKLGRMKPGYKKGVFMSDLHSFLDNAISDNLKYGLVHVIRNYPLFGSNNGLAYGFMESSGSAYEIETEDYYSNRKGVFAVSDPQNLSLNLNESIKAGADAAAILLKDA